MAPVMKLTNKDFHGAIIHVLSMLKDKETVNIIRIKMGILMFLERKQRFGKKVRFSSPWLREADRCLQGTDQEVTG